MLSKGFFLRHAAVYFLKVKFKIIKNDKNGVLKIFKKFIINLNSKKLRINY
jgi:hypothetical protein